MYCNLTIKSLLLGLLLFLMNGLPGESQQAEVKVVIDTYSNTPSLSSPVPLGNTVILVCRVGGMMPDTNVQFEWSCPGNVCNRGNGRYPNRRTANNTLVINVISESDAGPYSCTVKNGVSGSALGGAVFELLISGGTVVRSNHNLLPGRGVSRHHMEYASVNASRLDIHCSSHGETLWANINDVSNVKITENQTRSTLHIDPVLSFAGGQFDCYVDLKFSTNVYLFGNRSASLEQPVLSTVSFLNGKIVLKWPEVAGAGRYIISYRRKDTPVTVPPIFSDRYPAPLLGADIDATDLVAGATYEIGLWAVRVDRDVTFVSEPAVGEIDIPESVPSKARELKILNIINGSGVLLNWLPSANPNGKVTYFVQYSTDEGFSDGSITEVNAGADTTYYSLSGLQQGVRYYFRIRASNSAGSAQSNVVSHQFEIQIIVPTTSAMMPTTSTLTSTTSDDLRVTSTVPSSTSTTEFPDTIALNNGQEGLSSQEIVLYIVVPICLVLIVIVLLGIVAMIVVAYRSRKAPSNSTGISSSVHCATAYSNDRHRNVRPQSFVANPNVNDGIYDTLNGLREESNVNAESTETQHSERAIDVGYSTADDIGGINRDSVEGHLYETAQPKSTDRFSHTMENTKQGGESKPVVNPEDMYTKPDISKKMKRREQERLPHERAELEDEESKEQKDTNHEPEVYSTWNVAAYERPWSVS